MRWLLAIGAVLWMSHAQAAETRLVWFAPMVPAGQTPLKTPGIKDYHALFTPDAPWQKAKSRIHVFQLPTSIILHLPDDQLEKIFAFLKENDIELGLAYGMLPSDQGCGLGVEGFQPPRMPTLIATKVKKLGGTIRYIAMDEPLFFAHQFKGKNACRWPVEKIAREAAANIRQFRAVFPDVIIGDIEPHTHLGTALLKEWIDAYRQATGTPLAFFRLDMIWREPIAEKTREVVNLLKQENIPLSVIFNSRGDIKSDEEWQTSATRNIAEYRAAGLPEPDHVVIQSWRPYPTRVLPETDPHTLSWLVNYYFDGK